MLRFARTVRLPQRRVFSTLDEQLEKKKRELERMHSGPPRTVPVGKLAIPGVKHIIAVSSAKVFILLNFLINFSREGLENQLYQ